MSAEAPVSGVDLLSAAPVADAPVQQTAPQPPAWTSGMDPELSSWVARKGGMETPGHLAKAYHELEKTFGADKAGRAIVLPVNGEDQAGWEEVFKKLGRPENPDGYGIQPVEGVIAPEFAAQLAQWFHQAGLTPRQAQTVMRGWQERAQATQEASKNELTERQLADVYSLKAEWGPGYEQKLELGKRAVRVLGLDGDQLSAMESSIGTKAMLTMMAKFGEATREDAGVGITSGTPTGLPATATAAQAEIDRLMVDKEFNRRLTSDNPLEREPAQAMWNSLFKTRYPG